MADVDVMHTVEVKKTRKVKKSSTTKRRESSDRGGVEITEVEQVQEIIQHDDGKG
jgi:hypothetical protein